MDALTSRAARAYDRLRQVRSQSNTLALLRVTEVGYVEIIGSPITRHFYGEYVREFETGEQVLQILVIQDGFWNVSIMKDCQAVRFEGAIHKVSAITPPKGSPKAWLLRASATGES